MLTASFRKSELRTPGNRSVVVNPDMTLAIRPLRSLCSGDLFLSCVVQMSYSASFCVGSSVTTLISSKGGAGFQQ